MADLCYTCHKRQDKDKVVHSAVKLGRCSGCHDPHGGKYGKTLIRTARLGDVCFRCHCDDVTRRRSVHWPIKGRVCQRCHGAHGASEPNFLIKPAKKICAGCHGDKLIPKGSFGHGAQVRAGCQSCHDPHGSPARRLLKKPINALCGACHPKQRSGAHIFVGPSGRGHPVDKKSDPLFTGRPLSCISCHAMSSSTGPKMLRAKSRLDLCRRCHVGGTGKTLRRNSKRVLPSHHYPAQPTSAPPKGSVEPKAAAHPPGRSLLPKAQRSLSPASASQPSSRKTP